MFSQPVHNTDSHPIRQETKTAFRQFFISLKIRLTKSVYLIDRATFTASVHAKRDF